MTNADLTDDGRTPEQRLAALGLELPAPFRPPRSYCSVRVHGDIAYVSGHGPMRDGTAVYRGKLGADVGIETWASSSARLTALNVLASVKEQVGELSRVTGFLKLLVLVNATTDFEFPHQVADGAEPTGRLARTARQASCALRDRRRLAADGHHHGDRGGPHLRVSEAVLTFG